MRSSITLQILHFVSSSFAFVWIFTTVVFMQCHEMSSALLLLLTVLRVKFTSVINVAIPLADVNDSQRTVS